MPRVSSAIAGPGAAGIPVTSRGIARSFTVITGQTAAELEKHELNYQAMAHTDTVVLLMARKNLRSITAGLIKAGRDPETPVACIERAMCSDQRVTYSSLYGIADQIDQLQFANPMVTVIGKVANQVNPDLVQWPQETNEHYFSLEFGE